MNRPWIKEKSEILAGKLALFFVWPFGAWLYCLKKPIYKSSYIIFFLFSLLLCWHMAPTGINQRYDDFLGILEVFNSTKLSTDQFLSEVYAFCTFSEGAPKELYQDFLTWFTKLFTDNYHFMFLLAAIPVAYFQLKCLKLITCDKLFVPNFYGILAVVMMILPRDIITVQNPRFATGLWMYVFCSLYCFTKNKNNYKYLLPLIFLPTVHSGMWPALIMVLLYLIVPQNRKILKIFAILSIPFIFVDPNLMSLLNFDFLPSNLGAWVELYTSDDAYSKFILNEERAGFWWIDAFFQVGLKIVYILLSLQIIKCDFKDIDSIEAKNFYNYFLFSFIIINMIQFIPVVGERYFNIWRLFVFYVWYKIFHLSQKPQYFMLLMFSTWPIFQRYGYVAGGALSVNTPPDIFFTPLPYLMMKGLLW